MAEIQQGTIQIEDGLSARELSLLITASSTIILSVAAAVAIWKVATGIMWALVILAGGNALSVAFVGAGIGARHYLAGRALLEQAAAQAEAALVVARMRERARALEVSYRHRTLPNGKVQREGA